MWQPPERIKHALPAARWPSAEQAGAAKLFQPIRVGAVELAQRTWVPAMVPWRATPEGFVSEQVIGWYRRFAEGRPGAIVVEATGIRDIPSGPLLRIGHDRFIPGLRRLCDAVRDASGGATRLFIQCIDFLTIRRRPTEQRYFDEFLRLTAGHRARLADLLDDDSLRDPDARDDAAVRAALRSLDPSRWREVLTVRELEDLRYGYRERVTDLHLAHIRELPAALPGLFADAAARAVEAGFDGVELHYAHAYTMASLLSARNTRTDGYGGTREGRVRAPCEVLAAVRERVGGELAVGLRFLGDEVIAGGSDLDDAVYFGQRFAETGCDFLSISKGGKFEDAKQPKVAAAAYPYTGRSGYECMPTIYSDQRGPFGRNVPLAAAVRRAVHQIDATIPIVAAGGIATFERAEGILQHGEADIIAAARQSLADPDWFRKMQTGHGDQIRRCEFTNYCEALDQRHAQVTCKLWDRKQLDDIDDPDVDLDPTGRRRLLAPAWAAPSDADSPTC